MVSDGMLTKDVMFVADMAVTPSFTEGKIRAPKNRLPGSFPLNRETASGDRDRATGPRRKVQTARHPAALRSSRGD